MWMEATPSKGCSWLTEKQSIREFEVILALCRTAPKIKSAQSAQRLSYQLVSYLAEVHTQVFVLSPFYRKIEPSPTESLAFHLSGALLAIGINHPDLREAVTDGIWTFVGSCNRTADHILSPRVGNLKNPPIEDAVRTATMALALLGFLDAASAQADFWGAGGRSGLVQKMRKILSEPFLVAVETSLSTIRNSHSHDRDVKEWKRLLRHYTSCGRPLSAMLLQRSFMWLVCSSTSLMVADASLLRKRHILDLLMSDQGKNLLDLGQLSDGASRYIDLYASLAVEQMDYIEAGADFARLASPSQQILAYDVKSAAMITFLNCSLAHDEAADPEVLMAWLQETLEDSSQMIDDSLASVVLRCLALICRISPAYSSTVSRTLPRFLVRTAAHGETVRVASNCLAYVLKTLSKDSVISTLYTLGNVISPESEGTITNGQVNGVVGEAGSAPGFIGRPSTSSTISLRMSDSEESAIACGNVVEAICGIALSCQDEKITALAQSMLLQKLDKVNSNVDAQVLFGAATLALSGGQLEFRSLLKMYSRICHLGVIKNKEFLLAAVCWHMPKIIFFPIEAYTCKGHESPDAHLCPPTTRLASFRHILGTSP